MKKKEVFYWLIASAFVAIAGIYYGASKVSSDNIDVVLGILRISRKQIKLLFTRKQGV